MGKVIDIEERIPAMREKRRRKTNKKFLFVLAVFVLALLVILYFQSPLSRIKEITINDTSLHNELFYKEQISVKEEDSYWGFQTQTIENDLLKIGAVQEVAVSRKLPNKIEITVMEWGTIGYIENGGSFDLLLENGEVFLSDEQSTDIDAPVLNGFDQLEIRKKMSAQLMKLERDVYHLVSEIVFTGSDEDEESITIYMDDGYEVRAIIPTLSEKMNFYADVTAQLNGLEKGVIDMEVGTFFTPFSEIYGMEEEELGEEAE